MPRRSEWSARSDFRPGIHDSSVTLSTPSPQVIGNRGSWKLTGGAIASPTSITRPSTGRPRIARRREPSPADCHRRLARRPMERATGREPLAIPGKRRRSGQGQAAVVSGWAHLVLRVGTWRIAQCLGRRLRSQIWKHRTSGPRHLVRRTGEQLPPNISEFELALTRNRLVVPTLRPTGGIWLLHRAR
jgi:hypothetical protein